MLEATTRQGHPVSEPIRVLQVMASLDRGGAEAVVMDWLRRIDRERVVFDFVVNDDKEMYDFEGEAAALGCNVIRAPRFKVRNAFTYALWWRRRLLRHPEWQIVHAHHTVPAFIYLALASAMGKVTIAHSHIAGRDRSLAGMTRVTLRWPLRHVAQVRLACSRLAGDWMFGGRVATRVIHNGVELDRFAFDPDERRRLRQELGLMDAFVIGHVGRFSRQKNHVRILRIFAEALAREPKARLLLVGDGGLRPQIEQDISSLGLEDHVILAGVRDDIPRLLSAMDVLLFPSHYEGLPVTVVEAQASGLPCVVSDTVTDEIALTDLVRFVSLDEPDEAWADTVLQMAAIPWRRSRIDELRDAGYDSAQVAQEIQDLYLELAEAHAERDGGPS